MTLVLLALILVSIALSAAAAGGVFALLVSRQD